MSMTLKTIRPRGHGHHDVREMQVRRGLIGYAARRRWAERKRARQPFRLYLPTSPASVALLLADSLRRGGYGAKQLTTEGGG